MLEKAIARYDVDRTTAYFIGDSKRDVLAAENAGIKGVLVKPNDQLVNYLKATRIEVGLLINFGKYLETKRKVLSNDNK
jgi:histidinol phosphatase-like enzyme